MNLAARALSTPRARPVVVEDLLKSEATGLGPCQVRSRTDRPCPHQAVVEIWGLPFCKPCAREQEAYFAIGDLMKEAQGLRNEPLVEALDRLR